MYDLAVSEFVVSSTHPPHIKPYNKYVLNYLYIIHSSNVDTKWQ